MTNLRVQRSNLPLAIYREVAAHLSQVEGVQTELVTQCSQEFDYSLSQIDSLGIHFLEQASTASHQRVEQILAYYGDRYGAWTIT
jgi:hypothetical protein